MYYRFVFCGLGFHSKKYGIIAIKKQLNFLVSALLVCVLANMVKFFKIAYALRCDSELLEEILYKNKFNKSLFPVISNNLQHIRGKSSVAFVKWQVLIFDLPII